ncbi:MerR family transcriptional regulator [Actinosynnema sp. NPDC047251]|uniref:Transcriptional regulator, MerR family n=1 Tax=Saccharothrix espanaensis (strain ATCC 51144 / DSM 44229 / JCM 9112 / NBRC 15066 / NRRL 15764) TaxID=1179773 RepID=K0JUF8_SACES|nr:MerR family transcriptional regulator [Saccharothrix espanaensis]CCH29107.1 Transcriptional regulator, MerR family [Saccharothrix espanaensis DSM 44229]
MRPIDLARRHGLSTQAVRNYEDAGVLPLAARTASGYRVYSERHALALAAFVALVPGHGHAHATAIMVAATTGRVDDALDLVDRGHAGLVAARAIVDSVETTLRDITVQPWTGPPVPIGPLAHQLGLRPATLRRWEADGLLGPRRDRQGHRLYAAEDVRDAHLVGQLRRAGHLIADIRLLLDELRDTSDPAQVTRALADRRRALNARSRAMLAGSAALDRYLDAPAPAR